MKGFLSPQFVKFLVAGGIAALANFLSRILYNEFVSFSAAIILAYLTGMITAYLLNKLFVFESSQHSTQREVFYFTLVNLFAVLQTWLVSMWLYHYVFPGWLTIYTKEIAHLFGVIVPVFTSFLGHKYLTFKKAEHE